MAATATRGRRPGRRFLRFIDRALLGIVMSVVVLVLERVVLRSARRGAQQSHGASGG